MRRATKNKLGKDEKYLSWLHTQPCAVRTYDHKLHRNMRPSPCEGRITAHHTGTHGMSQSTPDKEAIPLCTHHHQDGPHAAHVMGKHFWLFHRIDLPELIAKLNSSFDSGHIEEY